MSWSQYAFLIGIKDEAARSFHEIEAARGRWSLRELRRQFDSALFERLALSRDEAGVRALAAHGQVVTRPAEAPTMWVHGALLERRARRAEGRRWLGLPRPGHRRGGAVSLAHAVFAPA